MREKSGEMDMEIHFKDAFRAFSKDDEGGQHFFDSSVCFQMDPQRRQGWAIMQWHPRYLICCCMPISYTPSRMQVTWKNTFWQ